MSNQNGVDYQTHQNEPQKNAHFQWFGTKLQSALDFNFSFAVKEENGVVSSGRFIL